MPCDGFWNLLGKTGALHLLDASHSGEASQPGPSSPLDVHVPPPGSPSSPLDIRVPPPLDVRVPPGLRRLIRHGVPQPQAR
eukprot:3277722-Pyramimonas_sp.AAC.1